MENETTNSINLISDYNELISPEFDEPLYKENDTSEAIISNDQTKVQILLLFVQNI